MRYFLGFDGGGTKTEALLVDENGRRAGSARGPGASYQARGKDEVLKTLKALQHECVAACGIPASSIAGVCVGLPLYGENPAEDADMLARLGKVFPGLLLVNDVEAGWAGSLACAAGINVVAGTGSIAFGRDDAGNTARCGGWDERFGDEGSSYWLGLEGMRLFTKQADGRAPKGPLYHLVRARYGITGDDFAFVQVAHRELLAGRDKTAAFQKLLAEAAGQGDLSVPPLYRTAAGELFLLAESVRDRLCLPQNAKVSYSGGTFRAGAMILEPFTTLLRQAGMQPVAPLLSPAEGAALLAMGKFLPEGFAAARKALLQP